ncbi:MAG: hypothetical protein Tsb0020_39910 [Haliangiales bacterium]
MTMPHSSPPPRPRPRVAAALLGISAAALLIACGPRGPVPEAPAPRRPEKTTDSAPKSAVPDDCQPIAADVGPDPATYKERSVVEATNLANEGFDMLQRAENGKLPQSERETMVIEAVDRFITALTADPYNVHATYNLAAAYARIGRGQCAVNLLDRLAALHRLRSYHDPVEDKLDRLLGRGKFRDDLDPDFHDLRGEESFREVINKFRK